MINASTIGGVNRLGDKEKERIYSRIIPRQLLDQLDIPPSLVDDDGHPLLRLKCKPGSNDVEMNLFHKDGFPDPALYGHLTDTLTGKIHILLYILNDPNSPRFDVDRMPDGSPTRFGILQRNLAAERAAMENLLAPGQIRRGLRMLPVAISAFEDFVTSLGHNIYFAEPLYYHNAVIFERYGFTYQMGRKMMERIEEGFAESGDLHRLLDDGNPFRAHAAEHSVRLRSWAIHDGLLGEPFTNVTMYKQVGRKAGVNTCPSCGW